MENKSNVEAADGATPVYVAPAVPAYVKDNGGVGYDNAAVSKDLARLADGVGPGLEFKTYLAGLGLTRD